MKRNMVYVTIGCISILLFVLSYLSSSVGERWVLPLEHIITYRIWENKEDIEVFRGCGMPVSEQISRMAEDRKVDPSWELYDDFIAWFYNSGRKCYLYWLFVNMDESIREPLENIKEMLGFERKYSAKFSPILPPSVEEVLYPFKFGLPIFYLSVFGIGAVVGAKAWRKKPAWFVPLVLILLIFPHAFLVWHADAIEIDRHSLQVSLQLYLGVWISFLFLLDAGWALLDSKMSS